MEQIPTREEIEKEFWEAAQEIVPKRDWVRFSVHHHVLDNLHETFPNYLDNINKKIQEKLEDKARLKSKE